MTRSSHTLLLTLALGSVTATNADLPRFESVAIGVNWNAGDSALIDAVRVDFYPISYCDGTFGNGAAQVIGANKCSAGHRLNLNNLNANFAFAASSGPQNGAIMRFGEYGGSMNIRINASATICFDNLIDIDGATIGGVTVHVVAGGFGNDCGEVHFEGIINQLMIGGQELWVDGICIQRSTDIDGNGAVDAADLAQLLAAWGSNVEFADFNCDEIINGADLAQLLADWS